MSELNAGLTLDFLSQQKQSSFALVIGDELGSSPIQVKPKTVGAWSRRPDKVEKYLENYEKQLPTTLKMTAPGLRRLRLYCSKEAAKSARLSVHVGQATNLGRREEKITETLTWTNKRSQSLRFTYDNPTAVIIDKTRFFAEDGSEVDAPSFIPGRAVFHHNQAVTGALVVEYSPEFSLFEIEYEMGEEQIDQERFKEMKLAWLAGNIRDADIPPVHVVALAEGHATQISFQRKFWPEGSVSKRGYIGDQTPPGMEHILTFIEDEPCWEACWQKVTGGSTELGYEDYLAIQECVEAANDPAPLQYVETDREIRTERIYTQGTINDYIDVEHPVTLTMKLGRADGMEVCDNWDPYPYLPQLTFRFKG
jgi:hypothetical protein